MNMSIYFINMTYSQYVIIFHKYNDIFTILTCNFSKEQYMLPEDDLRIQTCRTILSVLM